MHADILAPQMPQTLFLSQHLALGTGKKQLRGMQGLRYMQNLIGTSMQWQMQMTDVLDKEHTKQVETRRKSCIH